MKKNNITIIGTGLAGYLLAKAIRQLNQDIDLVMVTTSDGSFYSKPQLSTALTQKKTANNLVTQDATAMAEELNATLYCQTAATKIDTEQHIIHLHSLTEPGKTTQLSYDQLVLACGSKTLPLPFTNKAVNQVLSVNDLEAYANYRQQLKDNAHITIVGAGLVACEFANDLINTGYQVDMVHLDQYPLPHRLPEPLGQALKKALSAKGVRWHDQCSVTSVDDGHSTHSCQVTLSQGEKLTTDLVLSAIGLIANTELAEASGLAVKQGIIVNRQLETSAPDVYALGDCAEVDGLMLHFVAPIRQCVNTLAKTLLGEPTTVNYPAMPINVKTPACPVVICLPPTTIEGKWTIEGTDYDWCACYHDNQGNLRGFALTGKKTAERMSLLRTLPPLLN